MEQSIDKNRTKNPVTKKWSRSFRFGKREWLVGMTRENRTVSCVFEQILEKGDFVYIRRHIVQQLVSENRVRFAHHSQRKTLIRI